MPSVRAPARHDPVAAGHAALTAGRAAEARDEFEAALAAGESAEASAGLAAALWWLGQNRACVSRYGEACARFRRAGDLAGAVQCALWLAITYKANFADHAAANGWIGRAERLLAPVPRCPLHGWAYVARA